MAKYTSKYKELGFYVDDELKRFSNGVYEASGKEEQDVLNQLTDVQRVDEQPKAEAKPAAKPKTAPARKTSAK